jgi:hypothetical protein
MSVGKLDYVVMEGPGGDGDARGHKRAVELSTALLANGISSEIDFTNIIRKDTEENVAIGKKVGALHFHPGGYVGIGPEHIAGEIDRGQR